MYVFMEKYQNIFLIPSLIWNYDEREPEIMRTYQKFLIEDSEQKNTYCSWAPNNTIQTSVARTSFELWEFALDVLFELLRVNHNTRSGGK